MWSSVTERRIGTAGVSSTDAGGSSVARLFSASKTDWISAPTSAPATALFPTCAATISAVRARSSLRSMLLSSGILVLCVGGYAEAAK